MPTGDRPSILIVDDEEDVADVYALRLRAEYDTRVAYGGADALEAMDTDVDVVLLDRRMPDVAGDDVLERLRAEGYDARIIMLTAVDPGLDIVDMPFDDYLCKPIEKNDLVDAIEQQLRIQRYDEQLSEYLEVTSKLTLLETELPPHEIDASDDLQTLKRRAVELKETMDDVIDEFDDIEAAFVKIGRHPG